MSILSLYIYGVLKFMVSLNLWCCYVYGIFMFMMSLCSWSRTYGIMVYVMFIMPLYLWCP